MPLPLNGELGGIGDAHFFFLLAIIIFSQSRLQFWWGRKEEYVKRGSPDAFLKWGSGPQPRRAKRSRAGDDRGVKEMAVNNKVAAAGRPLHPRQREERAQFACLEKGRGSL